MVKKETVPVVALPQGWGFGIAARQRAGESGAEVPYLCGSIQQIIRVDISLHKLIGMSAYVRQWHILKLR
jgi:hypothetical protein